MQNTLTNNFENEWWYPIIQKHKIDISQFNHRYTFTCVNPSNIPINNWLILGHSDELNDRIIKLNNVIIIVLLPSKIQTSDQNYSIISTPTIRHDLDEKTIEYSRGSTEWYDIKNKDAIPIQSHQSSGIINFNAGIKIAPDSFRKFLP